MKSLVLFTLLGLSYALPGVRAALLGVQRAPTEPPTVGSQRSVVVLQQASCPVGHYECPEGAGNALILINCSLSESGKLQCFYGDTVSRVMSGSLGQIATDNGVNALPTIAMCSYDSLSGHLEMAASTACHPSAVVRTVYSAPRKAPGSISQRYYIPKHPVPNPHQPTTKRTSSLSNALKARLAGGVGGLSKRDAGNNTTVIGSPSNATVSDASTNTTTFNNHDY